MKISIPQTTYSKAQTIKTTHAKDGAALAAKGKQAGAAASPTTDQLAARIADLEQQLSDLLQHVYVDDLGDIHLTTDGDINVHAQEVMIEGASKASMRVGLGSGIEFSNSDTTITAVNKVQLDASQFNFSSGMAKFNCAFINASGIMKVDTLQANLVTATTYTPGAGNIW